MAKIDNFEIAESLDEIKDMYACLLFMVQPQIAISDKVASGAEHLHAMINERFDETIKQLSA